MLLISSILLIIVIVYIWTITDIEKVPMIQQRVSEEEMKSILNANFKLMYNMMFNRSDEDLSRFYLNLLSKNVDDIWKIRNQK